MKKNVQDKNPKVSIIIPVYNGENFLKDAIESALNQTYKNIEVIVVNDGSIDKSEKIALSYKERIRYFKKTNGGVASALNLALKQMTGEYFSWLSHDDLYYPTKIERQIEFLRQHDDDKIVLYSNYELLYSSKNIQQIIHNHYLIEKKPEYALLRGYINGITLLIPKAAFDKTGYFNENLRCTQDYDMWLRMMKNYKFIHMPEVLAKTRIHSLQDSKKNKNVIAEGNALWIEIINSVSTKRKIELENTEYNFYYEMMQFLITTNYNLAIHFCKKKLEELKVTVLKDYKKKLVSIIIPFYNNVPTVLNCLKKTLNQTYKNLEILLINDGSTENISQIKDFIKNNSNIKLLDTKINSGPSFARNIGIKEAKGDYIAFLDSDDEFLPNKIDEQLKLMLLHNPIFSHTSYIRRAVEDTIIDTSILNGNVIPRIVYNCIIATPTVMVKTEFLKKNNLYFNEKIRLGEDTCYWLEIAKKVEMLGINECFTIVNTNEYSSAYDNKKVIVGIKNIIKYIVNDQIYGEFNYELSLLCSYFSGLNSQNMINNELENIKNSKSWKITRPIRYVRIISNYIKEKGLKYTFINRKKLYDIIK